MSRASAIYRLQKIDTELDQRQAQLVEINTRLASNPAVQMAQVELAAAENELAAARRTAKALDDENLTLTAKIKETEDRLYGGKVKNPRELKDLQAEIESFRRKRGGLDEQQLNAMDVVEAAEKTEAAARGTLAAVEAARAEEQRDLLKDKGALEALIAKLGGEREAALISVSAEDRETYDTLRRQKRGSAVSLLADGTCSACGVAPSSSRIQAARQGGELVHCGNCGRILYAEQGKGYTDTDDKEDEMIQRW
ncbi:MAG: C4-type zinc ribbon domain-containing protein [Chloroflexota bacterium]